MSKRNLQISIGILLMIFSVSNSVVAQGQKPNILLILMDDLGYADVGFMPGSENDVHTPNIDALAQEGTIFTSAYVTHPFCGPSRTGIMTGRMPHDLGAQFNLAAFSGNGITTSEKYISTVLDESGYQTGIVGKWHLGEEPQYHPNSRGYDYFYGFLGGGHEYFSDNWISHSSYNPANYSAGNYAGNYRRPMMENGAYIDSPDGIYITDILTDAGVNFIDDASQNSAPFFLFMSYNAPHTPVQAKRADINAIKSELGSNAAPDGSERLTYTAMMYNADYNIKRLVDKLKNTGQYENTLIIFLSDNGGKTANGAKNTPLRGHKGDAYEGGFRVPMFFHWPAGNVPQGKVNSYNFSSLDFYPTFAYLAGASISESKIYDGINVWNHVVNETNPRQDDPIFVMRQHNGNNFTGVVKNNFKLYTPGNGNWYLYDLSSDIGETNNILQKNREIAESLKKDAYQWTWTQMRPQFFDNPQYGFEESWDNKNMPNFERTFGDLYNPADYETSTSTGFDTRLNKSMSVFPNPVRDVMNIRLGENFNSGIDLVVYDMQGRVAQLQKNVKPDHTNSYQVRLNPSLSGGLYVIEARHNTGVISKQVLLSR